MAKDEFVKRYDDLYQHAYYAWSPFFPLAQEDLRYYLGNQWSEKEKQKLFDENRNALVFNYVRRNINLVTGYQRKNRLSSMIIPTEDTDQEAADQMSALLLYALQAGDGYQMISDSFAGALKTGFNLATIWMDYRDDPINGDIRFGREPYSGFICDPYFTKLDFSDCAYVLRRKYLSLNQTISLLPEFQKELQDLHKFGWSRDDKFSWLPYQTQPNGQELMAYNEMYEQKWRSVPMLVDQETGEYTEWDGPREGIRYMLQEFPQLQVVKRPKRYIECHLIVNDQHIKTIENQYGLDEYPFVPFVSVFEPESEDWELKMQSLVRCMKDPQKEANKRRSQMIDLIDSQINSGWIATEDSVVNPRSLFQSGQGRVIWKKTGAEMPEKIQPGQIPPGMFQLQQQFDQDIMNIAGVNDASFGQTENAQESGLMMMLKQGSSIVNLQDLFDNLRYSQKMLSKKALKLIRTWTPQKMARILGKEPVQELFNPDFTKYDIAVQEGVLTDTQKQVYFRQLLDIKQLTDSPAQGPITPLMLLDAAPLQGKSDLMKQVAQNMSGAAEQAQTQAEMQQQLLDGQRQAQQAKAVADIALSKERFTRAIANLGLEDERSSKAVEDRTNAALDQVKAAKEIQGIDLNQLEQALRIIQSMKESTRAEEQEVKAEDVAIAGQGQEGAAAPPQF